MITYGVVDRAVHGWIADECGRSTVKNGLAMLSRVMEQAVRDGIVDRNPAKVTGCRHEYRRAEDELDDPRSVALPDWESLTRLAATLVDRSADGYPGWGDVVVFAACTAARIGEVTGMRARDIDALRRLGRSINVEFLSEGGLNPNRPHWRALRVRMRCYYVTSVAARSGHGDPSRRSPRDHPATAAGRLAARLLVVGAIGVAGSGAAQRSSG